MSISNVTKFCTYFSTEIQSFANFSTEIGLIAHIFPKIGFSLGFYGLFQTIQPSMGDHCFMKLHPHPPPSVRDPKKKKA